MAAKKPKLPKDLSGLEARVSTLERDVHMLRVSMGSLNEEMTALRYAVAQVDERTARGEQVMLNVHEAQQKMTRTVERIAKALRVPKGGK